MIRQNVTTQIDKVLALADSSHDAEAVLAVRKARQMLSRDGLNFSDLARAAVQKPRMNFPLGFFSSQHSVNLEAEILQLRQEIEDLRDAKVAAELQLDLARQRVKELEQKASTSQTDAVRWRQLARDTVEKLWDLSHTLQQEDAEAHSPDAAKSASEKPFPSASKSR